MPEAETATVPFTLKRRVVGNYADFPSSDFVWALSWLKDGKAKMRRKAWHPDLYVYCDNESPRLRICGIRDSKEGYLSTTQAYGASEADLFAEDWEVYEG